MKVLALLVLARLGFGMPVRPVLKEYDDDSHVICPLADVSMLPDGEGGVTFVCDSNSVDASTTAPARHDGTNAYFPRSGEADITPPAKTALLNVSMLFPEIEMEGAEESSANQTEEYYEDTETTTGESTARKGVTRNASLHPEERKQINWSLSFLEATACICLLSLCAAHFYQLRKGRSRREGNNNE